MIIASSDDFEETREFASDVNNVALKTMDMSTVKPAKLSRCSGFVKKMRLFLLVFYGYLLNKSECFVLGCLLCW